MRAENDQPYSKAWEEYTLDDLSDRSGYNVEGFAKLADVFAHLELTCPKCGRVLTTANIQK